MPKLTLCRYARMKRKHRSAHVRWKRRRLTGTPLSSTSHQSSSITESQQHSPTITSPHRQVEMTREEVEDEEKEEEEEEEEEEQCEEQLEPTDDNIGDKSDAAMEECTGYETSGAEASDHAQVEDPVLNQQLNAKAQRIRLTVRNVKSIIKNIITNEKVVAMVQQVVNSESVLSTGSTTNTTAGEPDSTITTAPTSPLVADLCADTRVTRSRARQLLSERQLPLAVHLATPVKRGQYAGVGGIECSPGAGAADTLSHLVSDRLLSSEDETDDEYTPRHAASTPADTLSPTSSVCSVADWASTPGRLSVGTTAPSTPGSVLEEPPATRTRSRLPLNDQPLELLEQMLDPPDVTPDMYQPVVEDEEWCSFLQNFNKPLADNTLDDDDDEEYMFQMDEDEAVEKEELRSDPAARISRREVNQLISELFKDVADLQHPSKASLAAASRAALLADFSAGPVSPHSARSALLPYQLSVETVTDAPPPSGCGMNRSVVSFPGSGGCGDGISTADEITAADACGSHQQPFSSSSGGCYQLGQLHVQMCQHVQLLAQTYLLAAERQWLRQLELSCRTLLVELSSLARAMCPGDPRRSSFWPANLDDALLLLARVDADGAKQLEPEQENRDFYMRRGQTLGRFTDWLIDHVLNSSVFIFDELLPTSIPRQQPQRHKYGRALQPSRLHHTESTDTLIAMGLQQFGRYLACDRGSNYHQQRRRGLRLRAGLVAPIEVYQLIVEHMVPVCTPERLRDRVRAVVRQRCDSSAIYQMLTTGSVPRRGCGKWRVLAARLPADGQQAETVRQRSDSLSEPWRTMARHGRSFFSISSGGGGGGNQVRSAALNVYRRGERRLLGLHRRRVLKQLRKRRAVGKISSGGGGVSPLSPVVTPAYTAAVTGGDTAVGSVPSVLKTRSKSNWNRVSFSGVDECKDCFTECPGEEVAFVVPPPDSIEDRPESGVRSDPSGDKFGSAMCSSMVLVNNGNTLHDPVGYGVTDGLMQTDPVYQYPREYQREGEYLCVEAASESVSLSAGNMSEYQNFIELRMVDAENRLELVVGSSLGRRVCLPVDGSPEHLRILLPQTSAALRGDSASIPTAPLLASMNRRLGVVAPWMRDGSSAALAVGSPTSRSKLTPSGGPIDPDRPERHDTTFSDGPLLSCRPSVPTHSEGIHLASNSQDRSANASSPDRRLVPVVDVNDSSEMVSGIEHAQALSTARCVNVSTGREGTTGDKFCPRSPMVVCSELDMSRINAHHSPPTKFSDNTGVSRDNAIIQDSIVHSETLVSLKSEQSNSPPTLVSRSRHDSDSSSTSGSHPHSSSTATSSTSSSSSSSSSSSPSRDSPVVANTDLNSVYCEFVDDHLDIAQDSLTDHPVGHQCRSAVNSTQQLSHTTPVDHVTDCANVTAKNSSILARENSVISADDGSKVCDGAHSIVIHIEPTPPEARTPLLPPSDRNSPRSELDDPWVDDGREMCSGDLQLSSRGAAVARRSCDETDGDDQLSGHVEGHMESAERSQSAGYRLRARSSDGSRSVTLKSLLSPATPVVRGSAGVGRTTGRPRSLSADWTQEADLLLLSHVRSSGNRPETFRTLRTLPAMHGHNIKRMRERLRHLLSLMSG